MTTPTTGPEVEAYLNQRLPACIRVDFNTTNTYHRRHSSFAAWLRVRMSEDGVDRVLALTVVLPGANPEWIFYGRLGRGYGNLIRALRRVYFGSDHDVVVGFVHTAKEAAQEEHRLYAEEIRLRVAHREWREHYQEHRAVARRRRAQKMARRLSRRMK